MYLRSAALTSAVVSLEMASACFLLRYSKSITESVRIYINHYSKITIGLQCYFLSIPNMLLTLHSIPYIVKLTLNSLQLLYRNSQVTVQFRQCLFNCPNRSSVSSQLASVTCASCFSFSSVTIERSPSKIKLSLMSLQFKLFFLLSQIPVWLFIYQRRG